MQQVFIGILTFGFFSSNIISKLILLSVIYGERLKRNSKEFVFYEAEY